ncbi:MAG: hypothetical protein ABJG78_19590 [Cyclobacteriaceae bacterium]
MTTTETQNIVETDSIWKALADPTRRTLMDLVRKSPKTTGHLVEEFKSIGRCAIMKHLSVLERVGLIIPKKVGKHRWNHINAMPLQEIYERWVKNYEALWATNLLQLKELAEYKSTIDQQTERLIMERSKSINILLEIPIKASVTETWDCLIKDVGLWWRKDFYTSAKTKNFIIEPKPGGRMYEDYGNDEGLVWADVIVIDSPNLIEFKGHLSPQFGGPAFSFLRLSLKEDGDTTILTLSDTVIGEISEKLEDDLSSGWKLLFEDGFKTYIEKK